MGREMEQINPETGPSPEVQSDNDAQEYLTKLKCLSSELDRAMEAIVSRELPSLRESLYVQRSTCARLSYLQQSPKVKQLISSGIGADPASCDLSAEIKAATQSLLTLNARYAALVKHSSETLRLLTGLYRGHFYQAHQGHARTALAPETGTQSWYCEI
jgi:hypothetical protein